MGQSRVWDADGPFMNFLQSTQKLCSRSIFPQQTGKTTARVVWHGRWGSEGPWTVQFEWWQSSNGESALHNSAFGVLRTQPSRGRGLQVVAQSSFGAGIINRS